MNKEEKESAKLETLIELLYTDRLSQYGKRKLVKYIEKQQKEIEEEKEKNKKWEKFFKKYFDDIDKEFRGLINHKFVDFISKDKIREKLNQINNEYSILLSNKSLSLERQNMNAQRHEAMRVVLEELLEGN